MTKPLIIIVISAVVVTMTSASLASTASAQQPQTSGSKFGTIGSLQYGNSAELIQAGNKYPEIKVPWILSGGWVFKNINSSSPTFNATLQMVMTNGTDPHSHIITDFKMTGSPTKKGIATTYNGTATMSVRPGYIFPNATLTDVPISIKLMGPNAMSIWIDPTWTVDHFGRTPIYGVVGGSTWPAMKMH